MLRRGAALLRRAAGGRRGLASAAVCTKIGAPLELRTDWGDDAAPLKPKQLRIRVAAAGVNFADLLQVQGLYQDVAEPPFVPGNEAAGEVTEVGAGASSAFAVGDRVICVSRGGAYASEIVTDASTCLKLPEAAASKDLAEAAALLINYGTAHIALTRRARLVEGETLLVTAAAGGVGLAAVELGAVLGAGRVIAACGSEKKVELARARGADGVLGLNYAGLDAKAYRAALKEVAGKVWRFPPLLLPRLSTALRLAHPLARARPRVCRAVHSPPAPHAGGH